MLERISPDASETVRGWIRRDVVNRYAIAAILFLAALSIRLLLTPLVGARPLLVLFVSAVLMAAIFAGLGPAIFATGLVLVYDAVLKIQTDRFQAADVVNSLAFCFIALEIYWFTSRPNPSRLYQNDLRQSAPIGDVLNALSDGVLVTDLDGQILRVNTSSERILGAPRIEGRNIGELLLHGREATHATGRPMTRFRNAGDSTGVEVQVKELRDAAGTGLLVWRLREADASVLGATGPSERPNDSEASEQPSSGPVGTEAFPGATLSRQAGATAEADGEPMLRLRLNHISSRERQVLEGLIDGKSNREIGLALKISARTVERHRANIMAKMEAASFSELLQMAFRLGIRGGANRSSGPPLFG